MELIVSWCDGGLAGVIHKSDGGAISAMGQKDMKGLRSKLSGPINRVAIDWSA